MDKINKYYTQQQVEDEMLRSTVKYIYNNSIL